MPSIGNRLNISKAKEQFKKQTVLERYDFDNNYTTLTEKFKKSILKANEDPTWMSFGLFPSFTSADSALLLGGKGSEKLKDPYVKYDTARWYLRNIGESERVNSLDIFQTILWHLVVNSPWYFESIEGLDKVLNFYPSENRVMNGGKDSPITITCWESVDLRITTMLYHYMLATTDYTNNRIVLPQNLDSFTLNIYINDFRTVNKIISNEFIGYSVDTEGNYVRSNTFGISDPGKAPLNIENGYADKAGTRLVKTKTIPGPTVGYGLAAGKPVQTVDVSSIPLDYFRGKIGFIVTLYGCRISKETIGENLSTINASEPEQLKRKIILTYERGEYELVNESLLYQNVGAEFESENLDKTLTEMYSEIYNPSIVKDKRNIRSKIEDRLSLGLNRSVDKLDNLLTEAPKNVARRVSDNLKAVGKAFAKQNIKKLSPFQNLKKDLGNVFEDGITVKSPLSIARVLSDTLRNPRFNPFSGL